MGAVVETIKSELSNVAAEIEKEQRFLLKLKTEMNSSTKAINQLRNKRNELNAFLNDCEICVEEALNGDPQLGHESLPLLLGPNTNTRYKHQR